MSTILFHDIVFGPIKSRRLGDSLGVNLAPRYGKICNFDCIYCECGFNEDGRKDSLIPTKQDVVKAIEDKLKSYSMDKSGNKIDSITFSGNGEPTMHPCFPEIIAETISLRNLYAPGTKVSVLTNGSRIGRPEIANALLSIDNAIIKIDSAIDESVRLINQPQFDYSVEKIVANLSRFEGKFVLQTMFLRGEFKGAVVDNTLPAELEAWYSIVKQTRPREVMIYTIDRETPAKGMQKVGVAEMEDISRPLREAGFKVIISG